MVKPAIERSLGALLFGATLLLSLWGAMPALAEPPSDVKVLIRYARHPGRAERAEVRRHGGVIKYNYRLLPVIAATVPEHAIDGLRKNPRITHVEVDARVHKVDAELDNTWGVKRIGSGTVHADGNRGTAVKVAIIDSGIDYTHPDLSANYAGGYDFVNGDDDPIDDDGHGTHVAGTVAAVLNGEGVVGAAPEARLYALKVLDETGSGFFSDIIAALEWAVENGVQVTNNSYGSSFHPGIIVQEAFDNAYAAGVLHVAAAGNSGNCGGAGDRVGYPAKFDSVIAVAATDQSDFRPCFSSTGPKVELAAPGVTINSTSLGGGYVQFSGTSMASPHVAGVAALVFGTGIVSDTNGDGHINDDARQILALTAEDLGNPGRDPHYGFGLVNAAAAVTLVLFPPPPAVNVILSTDKTEYTSGADTAALLTAVVKNEIGVAISGLDPSDFSVALNGVPLSVAFSETATPGSYSASPDLFALADGSYTVEATVSDNRAISGSGLATFTVVTPPVQETAILSVGAITYSLSGGILNKRDLNVTITVVDGQGRAVSGVTVSIDLKRKGKLLTAMTGTTGGEGTVTFTRKRALRGCYTTLVTNVESEGIVWDGATPANQFCK